MANLGTAYVQIVPAAQGISGKIQNAITPGAQTAGASAGQKAGSSMAQAMKSKMQNVGKGLIKAGAIATAVSVPIVAGIKDALEAYKVQSGAETKLTEIYKTRMGVSDKVAKKTMDLASALQKQGVVGDEVTLSGAQQLATFAKYPGTVNKLLGPMADLLVQQKGVNGTAEDATGIANLMGKAMMGQSGALKRVGISFDENQEKILKYGTEQEKAATLADVIKQNVGNMNAEFAKTPEGKMQQMSNSLGDMKEKLGAALAPALADLAKLVSEKIIPKVEKFLDFMQKHPMIGKIVAGIVAILAIGGPLLMFIGSIISAVGVLMPVLMGPVGIAILIAVGVVAAIIIIKKHWKQIKEFLQKTWEAIKSVAQTLWEGIKAVILAPITLAITIIKTIVKAIKKAFNFDGLKEKVKKVFTFVKNFMLAPITLARTLIKKVVDKIKSIFSFSGLKDKVSNLFKKIKSFITAPITAAKNTIKNIASKIKSFLSFKGLRDTVSKIFGKIRDAITAPIRKARDVIKGIIDKIKGFFHFDFHLPHLKLPHFSISPKGWKIGDLLKGSIPSLGIEWYAKGGIMKRPTLFGGGEAGTEAIVPLERNTGWIDMIADRLGANGPPVNITVNVSGADDPEEWGRRLAAEVKRRARMGVA